jgi:DNA-binding SARP family transcriptional activator
VQVGIAVMGGFAVTIDGAAVPAAAWRRRQAAALVKLLALAPRARLHRDRVIDALWPDAGLEAALPRLHKAAFFAREALGARDAVVVRAETVALFPGADLCVDVAAFDAAADAALHRDPSVEACAAALALHHGELLPDDLHEPWTDEPRLRLAARYEQLLHAHPERGPTPRRPRIAETLVERDAERAALRRVVRSVLRTGSGVVVAVAGEAGSGKSALVRAFAADLDDDVVVAIGSCDDLLAPRGLGPFREMVDALPDLAAVVSGPGQADDMFPAVLRSLAGRPTVVVVEDVHWADDATLDVIRYLSRRISTVATVLVLTYREEDVDAAHPLRRILGGLGGRTLERVELTPLSVGAIRALGGVPQCRAAEIHRITRGNAFFVTEVLDADGDGVPATVRDAVLARVGRLPSAARRLAERLAVVPSRAQRRLAEALAGDEPAALGQLERSGVISGGTGHVAFRHELARRAIEGSLMVSERIGANREVLDVLLRQPPVEPARIVHHAVAALRPDLLVEYGPVAAADAQAAGAYRQAAATLRLVLQHADRLDDATRARLLTRRAYALYVVNDYENGLRCAESAVALAADADPGLFADGLMTLSRITLFVRGPTDARQAAERAVRVLEDLGDDVRLAAGLIELARTHSNLPTLGIVAQPSPEGVRHAERAVALCERLGRNDLCAQALCYLGSNRLAQGDARGADDLERALATTSADPRLETRARILVNAAGSAYRAGRRPEALRYVAAGLRAAADSEFAAGQHRLHLTSAALAASAGPWDHAVAELRRLVASPGKPGLMALLARSLLARLLARRGDPDAQRVLAEALADPRAAADSYVAGPLAVAQVELGWLAGVADPVTPAVRAAWEMAERSGHTAMLGELAGYLRRAGCAVPPTTDIPRPWAFALTGRWREAAAGWRELGERYEEAVELALSDDDDAREAGLAALDELGARATVARVSRA